MASIGSCPIRLYSAVLFFISFISRASRKRRFYLRQVATILSETKNTCHQYRRIWTGIIPLVSVFSFFETDFFLWERTPRPRVHARPICIGKMKRGNRHRVWNGVSWLIYTQLLTACADQKLLKLNSCSWKNNSERATEATFNVQRCLCWNGRPCFLFSFAFPFFRIDSVSPVPFRVPWLELVVVKCQRCWLLHMRFNDHENED